MIILWCGTSLFLRSVSKYIFVSRWVDRDVSQKYVQDSSVHAQKNPYRVRLDIIDSMKHSSKATTTALHGLVHIAPFNHPRKKMDGTRSLYMGSGGPEIKVCCESKNMESFIIELLCVPQISRFPDIDHRCLGRRDLAGKIERNDDQYNIISASGRWNGVLTTHRLCAPSSPCTTEKTILLVPLHIQ